jgi:hypothetical protein
VTSFEEDIAKPRPASYAYRDDQERIDLAESDVDIVSEGLIVKVVVNEPE